ncbi:hypothetical protein M0R89_20145 (plasmid) [Halorussus limi]|uniref:KaiC-like domain-containing protein n=1 Tax=Halorussus limi TaxID=2938695 RepID=A0A8U0HZC2_9EURY|nr:hypothetical protein [Halorussus limi]UPV76475.1 hypothetical protein M0R89_20145 [Halorussus limi]
MSSPQSPPSNTLLAGFASPEDAIPEVCEALGRPAETNLLVISYSDNPDAWVRNWQRTAGERPSEFGFVNVGAKTRSAVAASGSGSTARSPSPGDTLPVAAAVSDPADLGRVGVRASEYLEAWADDDRRSVVVLDSLTALLDAATLERAAHFVHVLAGRVESVDGRGYFLMDPVDHDDVSVGVFREYVDAVVDLDASLSE